MHMRHIMRTLICVSLVGGSFLPSDAQLREVMPSTLSWPRLGPSPEKRRP
jgi:hypothetical protein